MTLLSPNHNYAADECMAQIHNHVPTAEERVKASERFDKDVLVAAHMAALHDAYILEMGTHPAAEVVIKPSSPTASAIAGLRSSTLSQLKVGKVHRRRVLHGTLCAKTLCSKGPLGFVAVNVLQDDDGLATPLYLANVMNAAPNAGSAHAQRMFPQNSKVAVREPYLTRLPDGQVILLVEKPSDLVFISVPENVEEDHSINGDRNSFASAKPKLGYVKYGNGKPKSNGNGHGLCVNGTGNRRNSIATADRSFVKPTAGNGGVESRRYSVGMAMTKDGAENRRPSFAFNGSIKSAGYGKGKHELMKNDTVEATSESSESLDSQLNPTGGYANGHGASSSCSSTSICQQVSSQNSSTEDEMALSNGEEGEVTSEPQTECAESLESQLIPTENENSHCDKQETGDVNKHATLQKRNSEQEDGTTDEQGEATAESLESQLIPTEHQNVNADQQECGESHAEKTFMVDNVPSENGHSDVQVSVADRDMSDDVAEMQNGDDSAAEGKASEGEAQILNGHCPAIVEHEVSIAETDVSNSVEEMQNGDGSSAEEKASEGENNILNGHCPQYSELEIRSQNSEHVGKCDQDKLDYKYTMVSSTVLDTSPDTSKPEEVRYTNNKVATQNESKPQAPINAESAPKISEAKQEAEIDDSATLRARGNALFAKGDLSRAGEFYTQAINRARTSKTKPEQEILALSNRAEVWLRVAGNMSYDVVNFEKALEDSEAALQLLLNHKLPTQNQNVIQQAKALFRKGRALMGLRRYHEALTAFQQAQELYPFDSELQEAIVQCKHRLHKALTFKPSKRQRANMKKKHHSVHVYQQQSCNFPIA